MSEASICVVCGNEIDPAVARCPHCGQRRTPVFKKDDAGQCRVVNLERGMPFVRDALARLDVEIETTTASGFRVLVLIHGYGSSGTGGAIRDAVRMKLELMKERKIISDILPGEECNRRSGHAKQLLKRFSCLQEFAKKENPGITLVIL